MRMLAVFSLPEGAGALNLRKERFELARLVHDIARVNNKSIELRVLQYGATRQLLTATVGEDDGVTLTAAVREGRRPPSGGSGRGLGGRVGGVMVTVSS